MLQQLCALCTGGRTGDKKYVINFSVCVNVQIFVSVTILLPQIDQNVAVLPPNPADPQAVLVARVRGLCVALRDNTLPRSDTLLLLRDLNACLAVPERLDPGVSSCMVECLTHLLEELPVLAGHVVTHQRRGQCGACGGQLDQVGCVIYGSFGSCTW